MASTIMSVCFFSSGPQKREQCILNLLVPNAYSFIQVRIPSIWWLPVKSHFMPRLVLVKSHVLFTLFFLVKILWKSNIFDIPIPGSHMPGRWPAWPRRSWNGPGARCSDGSESWNQWLRFCVKSMEIIQFEVIQVFKILLNLPRSMEETLTSHKLITCMAGIIHTFCVSLLYNRGVGRVTPIELSWKSK